MHRFKNYIDIKDIFFFPFFFPFPADARHSKIWESDENIDK